ncbi:hypothetical protein [Streptomyces tendae]|uniref:hypothetical protein n=1 Tax=Streptomyces tendae TaxID=1932 RepID=UPI003EB6EC6B
MKAKTSFRTLVAAAGALAAAAVATVVIVAGGTEGHTDDMADWNWGRVATTPTATEIAPEPEVSAALDPNWG